ncbi:hypothetical protein [Streptomyces sp. NPDC018031]|uniref:hypothetical protein n=1 Tax=Streptomyces sp. NPDC018031 TaxID=3365033 RepID=UPI003799217D
MNPAHPVGEDSPLLTLAVYRIAGDGTVLERGPRIEYRPGDELPPLMSHAYPPCACPRCRDR